MKHIFIIHSNTVLLSALGAIENEKIEHEDVLFLYGRNFTSNIVPADIFVKDVSSEYKMFDEKGIVGRRKQLKEYYKITDALIESLVTDFYEVYIPHSGPHFFQAFMTHPLCKGVSWLQEGAYSFFDKPLSKPYRVLLFNILFSSKRCWYQLNWSISWFSKWRFKPHKSYALDHVFFKPLDKFGVENVAIQWPKYEGSQYQLEDNASVFLFESAVELGFIDLGTYINGCRLLIEESGVKECYVKFHPNQKKENIEKILSLFKGIKTKECPHGVPFELIMGSSKYLNLFGFTTSLLKFGEMLGHHVIRKDKYLVEHSESFARYYSAMT